MSNTTTTDLICFSHLRWNFVYQRPQHLLTRFSKNFRVFFIEEPIFDTSSDTYLEVSSPAENLSIVVPHMQTGLNEQTGYSVLKDALSKFFHLNKIANYFFWYYTPMALAYSDHLNPTVI